MSNTPETDFSYQDAIINAASGDSLPIATAMLKQAKKLERERDAAREALVRSNHFLQQAEENLDLVYKERDEAREELAEARRESENLAKSIYRSEYSDNDTGWELLESVAGVISQIDNMYAGVREQRDEAREKVENQKIRIGELFAALEKLTAERDEARARVEIITPSKNNPVAEFFSLSNTPETDAAVKDSNGQWSFVLKETCQRLERERDEAILIMRETRRRLDDAWLEIERLKNP